MTRRYWLIDDRLCTSQELRTAGISRLRCIDLGRWPSAEQAAADARAEIGKSPEIVMAHNVRIACDSGRGARWGLNADQIARLRAGEILRMEDSLGAFQIGYSTFNKGE